MCAPQVEMTLSALIKCNKSFFCMFLLLASCFCFCFLKREDETSEETEISQNQIENQGHHARHALNRAFTVTLTDLRCTVRSPELQYYTPDR